MRRVIILALAWCLAAEPVLAANCTYDLNGDGRITRGETGICWTGTDGGHVCSIRQTACNRSGASWVCPFDPAQPCHPISSRGGPIWRCSPPGLCDPPPPPPPPPALSQSPSICGKDFDGDGAVDGAGETQHCLTDGTRSMCGFDVQLCTVAVDGSHVCPTAGQPCLNDAGAWKCSAGACVDPAASPPAVEPDKPEVQTLPDGARDDAGNCLAQIRIFSGRAMDCRPPGLLDLFKNCCADRGTIIKDSLGQGGVQSAAMGAALSSVFAGMSAAYSAYAGGASASAAASSGLHAMIVGIDPASIAAAAAIALITDLLLTGCNSQDMETGALSGSGMCHYVGSYCKASIPLIGCVQRAHGFCCYNSKLARIIAEQGWPQLKDWAGWGSAKSPNCRGFSAEEFQALDFSKIDLSDYYGDLATRAEGAIQINLQDRIDAFQKQILH